jgi:hypothetical protein
MAMKACEIFILPCLQFFPVPDQDYTVFFAMRKPRDPVLPKADTTPLMNARSGRFSSSTSWLLFFLYTGDFVGAGLYPTGTVGKVALFPTLLSPLPLNTEGMQCSRA